MARTNKPDLIFSIVRSSVQIFYILLLRNFLTIADLYKGISGGALYRCPYTVAVRYAAMSSLAVVSAMS